MNFEKVQQLKENKTAINNDFNQLTSPINTISPWDNKFAHPELEKKQMTFTKNKTD